MHHHHHRSRPERIINKPTTKQNKTKEEKNMLSYVGSKTREGNIADSRWGLID